MQLRPVHQYRPSKPVAGGRSYRQSLLLALIACIAAALLAASCSSSGSDSASDWLPDLKALGFTAQPQSQALINGDAGSAVSLYTRTDPPGTARVDVALYSETKAAEAAFTTASTQLSALPPGLFGANATQEKSDALKAGDSAVSYVTKTEDGSGNRVWTDTYRFGKAVIVAFVIAKDEATANSVRQAIADQLSAK